MKKYFAVALMIVLLGGCGKLSTTVNRVRSSVVHIEKVGEWEGSGFVLTSDGIICTAKHVVEGGGKFIVTFDDGTKLTTEIALQDNEYDVGFLKVKPDKPLNTARLASFNLRAGDPVFIMGSPLGYFNFNSVTLGIVSAKQRDLDAVANSGLGWHVMFQSDSAAYPGNSGGPVFNMQGWVIGILVAGVDASLNYSVPVDVFKDKMYWVRAGLEAQRFTVPQPKPAENDEWVPEQEPPTPPQEPETPEDPNAGEDK